MDISDIVKTLDEEEATLTKNVMAGSSEFVEETMIMYDDEKGFYEKKSVKYIPSLFKVIDEALVNCSDHAISCINRKTIQHKMQPNIAQRFVDNISVQINAAGTIIIENDGYGIPIIKKDDQYLPIILFTNQRTGTNTDADPYRITGGTNGCGAKIITTFSSKTIIRCQDGTNYFGAIITADNKGKKTIEQVKIEPAKDARQYTRIQFSINWPITKFKKYSPAVSSLFQTWLYKRCVLLSLFLNYYRPCNVKLGAYNLQLKTFARSVIFETTLELSIKDRKLLGYNNECFGRCSIYLGVVKDSQPVKLSIINGVEVAKNPLLDRVLDRLYNAIKGEVANAAKTDLKPSIFRKNILAVFTGSIMNPQWVGQTKNELTITRSVIDQYNINYGSVAKTLAQIFTEYLITKQVAKNSKMPVKKISNDKYTPALNILNDVKKQQNYLWLAEGDSALGFIKVGLSLKGKYNFNNSGRLSLGGVIKNVHNKISLQRLDDFKFITEGAGKSILLMEEKCAENVFIKTLFQELGLRLDRAYDCDADFNKLKYQNIIIATDQDKDGWNINGLLLVLFMKWPNILKRGMIKRLQTPIARLKPKHVTEKNISKTLEFFTEFEVAEYLAANNIPASMEIKYYKGLGGTEDIYKKWIFDHIDDYIYTFKYSDKAEKLIDVYYNKENADLRKKQLSTPLRQMTAVEIKYYRAKIIPISTFLEVYVKDYQLDNLQRKLLKVMDGQNQVGGKLLSAYDSAFRGHTSLKVDTLAGYAAQYTNYHHGVNSMCNTIFKNAQTFSGKKVYPILESLGGTGDRADGGKKTAAPRYVTVGLNATLMKAIFRAEDNILLHRKVEEDQTIEPEYYYGIVPMAILDNYKTTAHGWKTEIWARDPKSVITNIIRLIKNKPIDSDIPINRAMTKAEFVAAVDESGKEYLYSRGAHRITQGAKYDTLHITELPLGVWNNTYIADIMSDKYLVEHILYNDIQPIDNSSDDTINIMIMLRKEWQAKLQQFGDAIFSDVERAFKLRVYIHDELNFISPEGCVISFKSYAEFLTYWYNYRRKAYLDRIARQIEILKNRIAYYSAKCSYLQNFQAWGLGKRISKTAAETIMLANGLKKINSSLVEPPVEVPLNKIGVFLYIEAANADSEFDAMQLAGQIKGYASFEYLNSIRTDKIRTENIEPLERKLAEYRCKLAELMKPNVWKRIWLGELRDLASILKVMG